MAEIPIERFKLLLQILRLSKAQRLNLIELLLIRTQIMQKLLINWDNREVLPKSRHTDSIISNILELKLRITSLGFNFHGAFLVDSFLDGLVREGSFWVLFFGNAFKDEVEVADFDWFEGDADVDFGVSSHHPWTKVQFKWLIDSILLFLIKLGSTLKSHIQLNKKRAVRVIMQSNSLFSWEIDFDYIEIKGFWG